ncbi:MAG: LamG-like jellyroll fold domain-containing protein [Brevefilum sp.]
MKHKISFYLNILFLLILLTGCNLPGNQASTPDLIATEVARLLTEAPTETQIPTAEDPQPTQTSAISDPTATLTQTATTTSTPTSTATQDINDPAQLLGTPAWTQDFSASTSPWDFDSPQATFEVVNGALTLTAKNNPNWHSWYVSSPKLHNAYVEATVELSNCSGNDRFGLVVRSSSDGQQFYFMGITCSGQWGFFRMAEDVDIHQIQPFQSAEPLNDVKNNSHRVGIWMEGSSFTLYIDGEEVGTASDNTLNSDGYTGFLIAYANTSGFTVRVDKLQYWNIQ